MRQRKRQVTDKATICAMLDAMDTIHVAMHDEPFPYIVPLNFGYHWEDKLTFYFHASSFVSYAGASVKGHLHDYRSVTARGVAEKLEPDSAEFIHAHERLLAHNLRDTSQVHTTAMKFIELWKITCEDVTAKAEITPKSPKDVAYAPAKGDGVPLDESRILDMQK